MRKREFRPEFLQELDAILRSESMSMEFDSAGEPVGLVRRPFTEEWTLCALEFAPGMGRTRVDARFCAQGHEVTATIDAKYFRRLVGKRSRNPAFNSSRYSDLAVLVSVYIEEQVLMFEPSELKERQVWIGRPGQRR
jgi:hypothetical protein